MLCYTEWSSCVFMVIIHNLLFSKCCCLCDLPLAYLPHTCQSAFQTAFRPPLIKGTEWVGGGGRFCSTQFSPLVSVAMSRCGH